jgi:hypothetical protein
VGLDLGAGGICRRECHYPHYINGNILPEDPIKVEPKKPLGVDMADIVETLAKIKKVTNWYQVNIFDLKIVDTL